MHIFLDNINKTLFKSNGKIVLIPYFNGKVKEDGGVSGVVLGNNSHFTCHTFCYKNTFFLDYFGNEDNHEIAQKMVLDVFPTKDIDLCNNNKDIKGNFGKHIIIRNAKELTFQEGLLLVSQILKEIEMTPIHSVMTRKSNDYEFDIIQPIAESHISIHRAEGITVIDTFSCKPFDERKLIKLTNSEQYKSINRGIRFK